MGDDCLIMNTFDIMNKLIELSENLSSMNEVYVQLSGNKKQKSEKILIRNFKEASRSDSDPQHGPSIKVITSDGKYPISIPTTTIDTKSQFYDMIEEIPKNKQLRRIALNIVYENQVLILAYWFCNNGKILNVLHQYIEDIESDIKSGNYKKTRYPKSEEKLQEDLVILTNRVRKELGDNKIKLYINRKYS